MADDSNRSSSNPLLQVAAQIIVDNGDPDLIEVATANGEPVGLRLVYEVGRDAGPDPGRGSGQTRKTFSLSGSSIHGEKSSRYVFKVDQGKKSVH